MSYILGLVSNRLLTTDFQIFPRAVRMGFTTEQMTFRQIYTRVVMSSPGSITPPMLHIHTCLFTFDIRIQCRHWRLSTIHKSVCLYSIEWLNEVINELNMMCAGRGCSFIWDTNYPGISLEGMSGNTTDLNGIVNIVADSLTGHYSITV